MKTAMKICATSAIAAIALVSFTHLTGCQSKTPSQELQPTVCTSDDIVKLTSDLRNFCKSDAITFSSFTKFIDEERHGEWTLKNQVGTFDSIFVEYQSTKWKDVRIWIRNLSIAPGKKTKENDDPFSDMSIIISNDKPGMAVIDIMVDGDVHW
jgi:hypothetical protein